MKTLPARRGVALVFAALALPLVWTLCLLNPPMQAPDEGAHFARAVQVGRGGIVGQRFAGEQLGGRLPPTLTTLIPSFDDLHGRHHAIVGRARLAAAARLGWGGPRLVTPFPNTVIYPPWFYAPQALAIDAGRLAGVPVLGCMRLARLAAGSVSVLLAAIAIATAAGGASFMAAVLALPMTLSLFASVSQDGPMIATTSCLASFLSRRRARGASIGAWLLAGAGLGALGAARAPYLLFCLLPLLVAGPTERRRAALACLVAVSVALAWLVLGSGPLLAPTRAGGGMFRGAQMAFLLSHPGKIPLIAATTLGAFWYDFVEQFVGVLNWLDVTLPTAFIDGALALLALELALSVRRPHAAIWVVVILTVGATFGALYLAWSPAGSAVVEGVQGRYFLPTALMAALALGRPRVRLLAWSLVAGLLVADWLTLPALIFHHYSP